MFKKEFPLDDSLIYLNHAAVAPWPARTADAVCRFAQENSRLGASHYLQWMEVEQQLRDNLAWLINAPSVEDISIQKSTSEALSTIAYGLEWLPGQNVVFFKQEFPSNRIVWQTLEQFGVEARLVDLEGEEDPEKALFSRCDENTRLITVSSVQYASGLRMDLQRIGDFCKENGILFCVDAIQSLGAFEFDVQQIGADFVVADGHKWMLGPEGVALLFSRAEVRQTLKLHQFGWHMLESTGDYEDLSTTPTSSGRRFECGSPNMLGIYALNSSLTLIREIGIDKISALIQSNSDHLIGMINAHNRLELISPQQCARRSGIVTFKVDVDDGDHDAIYRTLMNRQVICAPRGGGIRFSPHFYTGEQKLNDAMEILDDIISSK